MPDYTSAYNSLKKSQAMPVKPTMPRLLHDEWYTCSCPYCLQDTTRFKLEFNPAGTHHLQYEKCPQCHQMIPVMRTHERRNVPIGPPGRVRTIWDPVGIQETLRHEDPYKQVGYFDYAQQSWNLATADEYMQTQEFVDAMPDDGIISVAHKIRNSLDPRDNDSRGQYNIGIRPKPDYIAPATGQYLDRKAARRVEAQQEIINHEEIEGYVQAHFDADPDVANEEDLRDFHLGRRDNALVYLVLSGYGLMMWRSKEEYDMGKYGHRGAPRAVAWFDMKKAFDVAVEQGDKETDLRPHRIAVQMTSGVVFFRVFESGKDVEYWYHGLRGVIRDFNWKWTQSRDTWHHKEKRWHAAVGVAKQVAKCLPIGERAMAVLFHCYDMDYDCYMRVGEIMNLILEVEAALFHLAGYAETKERDGAIEYAMCTFSEFSDPADSLNNIFEKAMLFRNNCDKDGNGKISKDEFMAKGQRELCYALQQHDGSDGSIGRPDDPCSIM